MENDKVLEYVRKYKRIMLRFYHPDYKYRNFISQIRKLINMLKSYDYDTRKSFVYALCDLLDEEGFDKGCGIHRIMYYEIIQPVMIRELCEILSLSGENKVERDFHFTNSLKIYRHLDLKNWTDEIDKYYF